MPNAISPDKYWASRAEKYRELTCRMAQHRYVDPFEYSQLKREFQMGLFVQGMNQETRLEKVKALDHYNAQLNNGEKPTPPWKEERVGIEIF